MDIDDGDLEAFYMEHFTTLTEMGVARFDLSQTDAEDIANEILLATIFNLPRIEEIGPWLTGALTCAVQRQMREA